IAFVVMGNVFPPDKDVHATYDLKGSTAGRVVSDAEIAAAGGPSGNVVLKDLNWLRAGHRLRLGPRKARLLLDQLALDVAFLRANGIMDYSLLVGCHDLPTSNLRNIRAATLAVFEPNIANITMNARQRRRRATSSSSMSSASIASISSADRAATRLSLSHSASVPALPPASADDEPARAAAAVPPVDDRPIATAATPPTSVLPPLPATSSLSAPRLPASQPPERTRARFYRELGGLLATDARDLPDGSELYFLGVIDIFTRYGPAKRAEHAWKSLFAADPRAISAVNPAAYADRFLRFVQGAVDS
ncbi:Phosphatidylinositol-4-phosphate 5-kinase, partial [Cladochytrium tenue]